MASAPSLQARLMRTRWLVRAPIWLFRARLGFLIPRLVLLEHRGRTSGKERYVVLEVLDRPDPRTVHLASGFGTEAHWYRNLLAEPRCRVSVGRQHLVPAEAHALGQDEAIAILEHYRIRHPKAADALDGLVRELSGTPIENVPVVELTLHE